MHRTHAGCSLFAVILCLGAAVTQPDGSFEIPGVPVGEIELQLWHEKTGSLAPAATVL